MENFAVTQNLLCEVSGVEVNPYVAFFGGGLASTAMGILAFHRKRASLLAEAQKEMIRVHNEPQALPVSTILWRRLMKNIPSGGLKTSKGGRGGRLWAGFSSSLGGSASGVGAAPASEHSIVLPLARVPARSNCSSVRRSSTISTASTTSTTSTSTAYHSDLFDDDCAFLGLEPGTASGGHGSAHALRLHAMSISDGGIVGVGGGGAASRNNFHPYQKPIDARITAVFTKSEIAWLLLVPAAFIGCVGGASLIALSRYLGVHSTSDVQEHYWWLFRSGLQPRGLC